MNREDADEHLVTSKRVSEMLGISVNTLTAWRIIDKKREQKPRIPFLKIGHKVRYRLTDVRRFIEKYE